VAEAGGWQGPRPLQDIFFPSPFLINILKITERPPLIFNLALLTFFFLLRPLSTP